MDTPLATVPLKSCSIFMQPSCQSWALFPEVVTKLLTYPSAIALYSQPTWNIVLAQCITKYSYTYLLLPIGCVSILHFEKLTAANVLGFFCFSYYLGGNSLLLWVWFCLYLSFIYMYSLSN
jgi:hypothetical protein